MAIQSESGQIQDFLDVFKKRRWQVILPALFILALGSVFAVIVPKKYVVETTVELLQPSVHFEDPEESATVREIANAEQHVKNHNRVKQVIEELVWGEYTRLNDDARFDFIRSVRNNVEVDVLNLREKDGGSVFVNVSYRDVDGRRAEKFLSALTDRWLDDVVQRDINQLKAERDEYQNQAEAADTQYGRVLQQFTDLVKEMGISITQPTDLQSQREEDPLFVELALARQNRDTVEADLEQIRAEVQTLRASYEQMDRRIPEDKLEQGVNAGGAILELEQRVAALRDSQRGLTPEHSTWKRAESEIEGLREQIETVQALQREEIKTTIFVDNPARKSAENEIRGLEVKAEGLLAKLESWKREVEQKYTRHQAQISNWNDLLRIHKAWQHAGADLDEAEARLRKLNVRLGAYAAAQGKPYRIAEAPRAPKKPSVPNPWVIVAVSLFAGLAFGLAVAFIAEFARSCYRTVADLTRVMGVPVLGVVNTIKTRADRRRQRLKRALIGGSSLVILGSLAWFTFAWALHPEQLPTSVIQVVNDFRLSLR